MEDMDGGCGTRMQDKDKDGEQGRRTTSKDGGQT